jgi:hypothetical protein
MDVLHVQLNWTQEQRGVAEGALLLSLTEGKPSDRVHNWKVWLGLVDNYLKARIHLITNRSRVVQRALSQYVSDYAKDRPA